VPVRPRVLLLAVSLALVSLTSLPGSAARLPVDPIPATCARACLEDLVHQYLAAVVAHSQTADMSMFAGRASSIEVAEAFRIENGLIRRVEMIGSSVPYHFNSAWPGGLSGRSRSNSTGGRT
jgi:hypothetical protein